MNSTTQVALQVLDADGNPVLGNYSATIFINENGVLEGVEDLDEGREGTNTSIDYDDTFVFTVKATQSGAINIKARVDGIEQDTSLSLNSAADTKVTFQTATTSIPVGSTTPLPITIATVDGSGQPLAISQPITLEMSPSLGQLNPATVVLQNGQGQTLFTPGPRAGTTVLTSSPIPAEPFSLTIGEVAGSKLKITSEKDFLKADGSDNMKIAVSVLDAYGNADTAFNQSINLRITDATRAFGTIAPAQATPQNGVAEFTLTASAIPGDIHLIATAGSMLPGALSIGSKKLLEKEDLKNINFSSLYTTLLGTGAGDVRQENYPGGWFLFHEGKTEAVTTLTVNPSAPKALVQVRTSGMVIGSGDGQLNLENRVVPHANKPIEITTVEKNLGTTFLTTYIEPPKNLPLKLIAATGEVQTDGIYFLDNSLEDTFEIREEGNRFAFYGNGSRLGAVMSDGYLDAEEPLLVTPSDQTQLNAYVFDLSFGGDLVGQIIYKLNALQVKELAANETIDSVPAQGPGIYVQLLVNEYILQNTASGISLVAPAESEKIDEPFISVEDSDDQEAVGWQGDFKNELLFAAGNSVGDSTKWYASSILINLGDPVVSVAKNNQTGSMGFTQDVGRILTNYPDQTIRNVLAIDYNRDNQRDIFVVLSNGQVDLLQNFGQAHEFKPMGTILKLQDGVQDLAVGDMNGDGWDDLVGVSDTGQAVLLKNTGGAFEREDLELDVAGRIMRLRVGDLDHDGKMDLATSDDNGDIKIFYGTGAGLSTTPYLVDNLGIKVTTDNLNMESAVYLSGLPARDPASPEDAEKFVRIPYSSTEPDINANINSLIDEASSPKDFMKLNLVTTLSSEKRVRDENSGNVQIGDTLEYTISLSSPGGVDDLALADFLPDFASLENTSITCEQCGPSWQILPAGHQLYPLLIGRIKLSAGQRATITYRATVTSLPIANIEVGDFEKAEDPYLDIYARDPEGNSDSLILYSTSGPRTYQKSYVDTALDLPDDVRDQYKDENGNGIPDRFEKDSDGDGIPDFAEEAVDDWTKDTDGDGIPDQYDDYEDDGESLEDMIGSTRDSIENIVAALCGGGGGGGCMSLPINIAFLAPGSYNVAIGPISIAAGFDQGTPIFGIMPNPSYVCSGAACFATSTLRFYLAPTLTGGLGIALCLGVYGTGIAYPPVPLAGNCFVYAVPIADMLSGGACSQISAGLNQIIAAASGAGLGGGGRGVFRVGYATGRRTGSNTSQLTFDNGTFNVSAINFRNSRPGSFPDFIMDWVDRQIEEITTKLTDMPTIYLILPDFKNVFSVSSRQTETKKAKSVGDVVDYLNTLPFVKVTEQSVPVKYPRVTKEQLKQVETSFNVWLQNAEKEIESYPETQLNRAKISVAKNLVNRVKQNLRTLQSYADFPKYIQLFSQWKTVLVRQIVVYLDKIADAMGGYYVRNKIRAVKWMELFILIKEILKGWQMIPKILLDFRSSCSSCTNDRGNAMYWYLKLFSMLIPQLPVIPFPKWPDIVIDVSNINAVIDIPLPSPKFVAQDMVIPRLPRLDIANLDINLNLDGTIPLLPRLPNLSRIFPKLPNLPLPKLPDLPPPPKIPQLLSAFKSILEIIDLALYVWCLYKKGLPLVKEWELKPTIENLTERSGFMPSLDFLQLSFPEPRISFVDQIRVDAYVNIKFRVNALVDLVKGITKPLNAVTTNLLRAPANLLSEQPVQPTDIALQKFAPVQNAVTHLAQLIERDKDKLVTTEEMRAILLEQTKELSKLTSNPAMTELTRTLELAGTSYLPVGDMTPVISPKTVALKQEMLKVLAASERDERTIKTALSNHEDLFARQDLQHLFGRGENMLAAVADENNVPIQEREFNNIPTLAEADPVEPKVDSSRLLAQTSGMGGPSTTTPSVQLDGIFLYDSNTEKYESLIAYTAENGSPVSLVMTDFDQDTDEDVLYSMGGTLYFKENRTIPRGEGNYLTSSVLVKKLADEKVARASINYLEIEPGNNKSTLSWLPDTSSDVIGYRISLKKVINLFDLEHVRASVEPTQDFLFYLPGQEDPVRGKTNSGAQFTTTVLPIEDPENPSTLIELTNGNYYGKIVSLTTGDIVGTLNEIHLFSPQRYGDTRTPTAAVVGGNVKEVPILQSITLDASLSYKQGGTIVQYYWDKNPGEDTDGDGLKTNDNDTPGPGLAADAYLNPKLQLGPFTTLGEQRVFLNVVDDAGNHGQTEVVINVFVPDLSVDDASTAARNVTGNTHKKVADEPVAVIRVRNGQMKIIKTPTADSNGKYLTDGNGGYQITDFNNEPGLILTDRDGNEIATINEESGRVTLKDPAYTLRVVPGDSQTTTHIDILLGGEVVATVTLKTDPNEDVVVHQTANQDSGNSSRAIHVYDMLPEDTSRVDALPGNAPSFPGGAVFHTGSTLLAMLGTNGDIRLPSTGLDLKLKPAENENDPVILQVMEGSTVLYEIVFPLIGHVTLQ